MYSRDWGVRNWIYDGSLPATVDDASLVTNDGNIVGNQNANPAAGQRKVPLGGLMFNP